MRSYLLIILKRNKSFRHATFSIFSRCLLELFKHILIFAIASIDLWVLYRDQCAYKKDGGNTEDTYCFKTEGATHTTECVETGQQSGYHHKLWSVSLKNLEEINLFHILCLLRVSQHPIRRIRQLPLQQGQSEFCGVPDKDRHAGRLLATIWHCHHIRRGHHHSNIYII